MNDTPLIVVVCPALARRLAASDASTLAQEPLRCEADRWERWFAPAGRHGRAVPTKNFYPVKNP
jgi:hypothetical protein